MYKALLIGFLCLKISAVNPLFAYHASDEKNLNLSIEKVLHSDTKELPRLLFGCESQDLILKNSQLLLQYMHYDLQLPHKLMPKINVLLYT